MLARATARRQQIAVQQALGASRARIGVQLATEGLLLGAAACVLGLVIAQVGIELISWLRPTHLPRESAIAINPLVALVAVGLSIAAAIACSLVPVSSVWRQSDNRDLATRARRVGRRRAAAAARARRRRSRVVYRAARRGRADAALVRQPHPRAAGFDATNVLTARVPFSLRQFPEPESRVRLQRDAVAAVKALPGVVAASAVHPLPFASSQVGMRIRRDASGADQGFVAMQQVMLPGYLGVAGIPLLRGRDVSGADLDDRRDVAVVDERFARMLTSGDPIGRQFHVGKRMFEVIGVTPPVRVTQVRDEPRPHFFVP